MPLRSTSQAGLRPTTGLSRRASRLLTVAMGLSAVAFVVLTVGSSLVGSTAFYGGGNIVNAKPWISYENHQVEVTNNSIGDTIDSFIPGSSQMVHRAWDGDFPGWNQLQGAGSELGSVPSYGLFAPTAWVWWVLPHSLAPAWEKLSVLVLSTVGTALFLRRLRLSRHAAWLGGMIYAGSGFMIAWTNWPQAGVAAMLPWLFWSAERALQLRTWRAQIPVALTVAFLILGGFPAVAGLGLYAAGLYVVLRLVTRHLLAGRWRAALADAGRLTVGLITGFLLAGVQLAVFVYALLGLDTAYRANAFHDVPPLRMLLLTVFPNAWGTATGAPFYTETNPIETNVYIGVAALVLAAAALLLRPARGVPRGVRTYFTAVVIFGGLLVYVQGPLLDWVGDLPVFSGNAIGRLVSVLLLAASIVAAIGFDAVLRREGITRAALLRIAAGLFVVLLVLTGLARWIHWQTGAKLDLGAQRSLLAVSLVGAGLCAIAVLVALLRPSWRAAVLAAVPVVVAVQGITAASPMWAQVDRHDFYPVTPVHRFLLAHQGDDRIAVSDGTMGNGATSYYGLRSATGHVFSRPEFTYLERQVCNDCRISPTYWVLPGFTDLRVWQSPGLDRMGVRYITADPESQIPGTVEQIVAGDQEVPLPTAGQPPMTVTAPAGPLRGVLLDFRSGPAQPSMGNLVVEVVDAGGQVLASTRRFIQFPRPAVPLYAPLTGEDLPSDGSVTIRLHWDGATSPPVVAADDQGRPALSVIRPADDGLRLVYSESVEVWERLTVVPRIHWADQTRIIPDEGARLAAVTRRGLPGDIVVLSRPAPPADGRPADLAMQQDSGDEIRVRVDAQGGGYLVVADSIQTDWTATVDGRKQEIVAADHAFGAVHVPAGTHQVALTYTPRGGTAGLVATGAGGLALLLMALPPAWFRRRRDPAVGAPDEEPLPGERLTPTPVG